MKRNVGHLTSWRGVNGLFQETESTLVSIPKYLNVVTYRHSFDTQNAFP